MCKKQTAATAAKNEHQIIYEIPGANLREVIAIAFNIFDKTWAEPFSLMLPDKKSNSLAKAVGGKVHPQRDYRTGVHKPK